MGKAPKLRDACLKGDVKTARARIKAGAALDATDEVSCVWIKRLCAWTDARFLVVAGFPVQDGLSVFHCAAMGGSVVILKLMLDHGADAHVLTNVWAPLLVQEDLHVI
jgi:hypothetical protein